MNCINSTADEPLHDHLHLAQICRKGESVSQLKFANFIVSD